MTYGYGSIKTISINHLEEIITVEAHILMGIRSFVIVGLANKAIKEAEHRIRIAFQNSQIPWPKGKIVINLQPANEIKNGTHYDLPISLAILQATGKIKKTNDIFFGELSLLGELIYTTGGLICAKTAKKNHLNLIAPPKKYLYEICEEIKVNYIPTSNLLSAIAYIQHNSLEKISFIKKNKTDLKKNFLFRGQKKALRALEIACAGNHHIAFIGAPGIGKSFLSQMAVHFLPPMPIEQKLEVLILYELAQVNIIYHRPYRNPHSSSSLPSIIGGGTPIIPGEVSLSHGGILHLDEISQFSPKTIESLRDIIENKEVSICRASHRSIFPANFQLILTANPCKCGYYLEKHCKCKKIFNFSGPISSRIPIRINMKSEKIAPLKNINLEVIRQKIMKTRYQLQLFSKKHKNINSYIQSRSKVLQKYAEELSNYYQFSLRTYNILWKLALTISLYDQKPLNKNILLEASLYVNME